jgi:HSP20 family molecular chaperone IbpA
MELTIWRPFAGLESFNFQFKQLFDQTLARTRTSASSTGTVWYPAVDVLESKDSYLLRAELPGMNKEYFNLEVKTEC